MLTLKRAAFLAGVIGLGAVIAAPAQATPGFRLIVEDITNPDTLANFYSGTTNTSTGDITFHGFTFGVQMNSNFPGGLTIGTLSTQITFSSSGIGSLDSLRFTVFVADDSAPSTPLKFTSPIGTDWVLTGQGGASGNLSIGNVTMVATNFLNAATLVSPASTLGNAFSQSTLALTDGSPYELKNVISLTNATGQNGGWSSVVIQNTESIEKAPEPASIALIGAGLAGLGFFRRRSK